LKERGVLPLDQKKKHHQGKSARPGEVRKRQATRGSGYLLRARIITDGVHLQIKQVGAILGRAPNQRWKAQGLISYTKRTTRGRGGRCDATRNSNDKCLSRPIRGEQNTGIQQVGIGVFHCSMVKHSLRSGHFAL